jgi:branched-chain amino acid transport system ATP-binding protein
MTNAKIFLLDEPIGGVNPILARKIFDYIAEYKKEKGGTFIIVEHRLDIAMPYADYIYAMSRGRIVAEGPREEITESKAVLESYLNI